MVALFEKLETASTLALFGPSGRRGKLIEQALQALG